MCVYNYSENGSECIIDQTKMTHCTPYIYKWRAWNYRISAQSLKVKGLLKTDAIWNSEWILTIVYTYNQLPIGCWVFLQN